MSQINWKWNFIWQKADKKRLWHGKNTAIRSCFFRKTSA